MPGSSSPASGARRWPALRCGVQPRPAEMGLDLLYLGIGWAAALFGGPLIAALTPTGFALILVAGASTPWRRLLPLGAAAVPQHHLARLRADRDLRALRRGPGRTLRARPGLTPPAPRQSFTRVRRLRHGLPPELRPAGTACIGRNPVGIYDISAPSPHRRPRRRLHLRPQRNDSVDGYGGDDIIYGEDGNDTITGPARAATTPSTAATTATRSSARAASTCCTARAAATCSSAARQRPPLGDSATTSFTARPGTTARGRQRPRLSLRRVRDDTFLGGGGNDYLAGGGDATPSSSRRRGTTGSWISIRYSDCSTSGRSGGHRDEVLDAAATDEDDGLLIDFGADAMQDLRRRRS